MRHKGYTLVELVVVVSLISVVLLGGTAVFYRSLRSNALGNMDLTINLESRSVLSLIEKDIRFGSVKSIVLSSPPTIYERSDCLSAGSIVGDMLVVSDMQGLETTYSLSSEKVASTSAVPSTVFLTNSSAVTVKTLRFTWYCQSGISDKIKIDISMENPTAADDLVVSRTISKEINLLNSGIN